MIVGLTNRRAARIPSDPAGRRARRPALPRALGERKAA